MKISVKFDPHDLWIGVYWRVKWHVKLVSGGTTYGRKVHIYICVVPMLPIHIEWWRKKR